MLIAISTIGLSGYPGCLHWHGRLQQEYRQTIDGRSDAA